MLGYKTAIIDIEVNGCNTKLKNDFILDFYKPLINTTFHPMKKNIKVCKYYTDINTENVYDLMKIYKMVCSEPKDRETIINDGKLKSVLNKIPERKQDDPLLFNVTYVVYNHAINETRNIMGFFQHTIEIKNPRTDEAKISFEAFSELRVVGSGSVAQTLNQLERFVIFQIEDGKFIDIETRNQHISEEDRKNKLYKGIAKERFTIENLKSIKQLDPKMLTKCGFFRTYLYENRQFWEDRDEHYRKLLTPARLNKLNGKSTKLFGKSHNVFDILTTFYEFIQSLTFIDFNNLQSTITKDELRDILDLKKIKDELTYYNLFLKEEIKAEDSKQKEKYNTIAKRFQKFAKYYIDSLNKVFIEWREDFGEYVGRLIIVIDNEEVENIYDYQTITELLYLFNVCYILLEGNANVFIKNADHLIEKYSHLFKDLFEVVKQPMCFIVNEEKYYSKVLNQMYRLNNSYYKQDGRAFRNIQYMTIFDRSYELNLESNNVNITNTVLGLKPKISTNYDLPNQGKLKNITKNVVTGPDSEEALNQRAFIKDLKKIDPKNIFSLMSTSTISVVDTTPNKLRRRMRTIIALKEQEKK